MIEVCAIASGSNGNCYYIGNEDEAILIDAGISCKQILLRMELRGLDSSKLKAVFLTHEHADHIRGARVLSKKLNIPVFYTYGTWNKAHKSSKTTFYRYIQIGEPLSWGSFMVHAFAKNHDANEPCSYRIETEGQSIGVMTDIGAVCSNVIEHFQQCSVVFLESNYDEQMLVNGSYPWYLKQRILSDVGHLSNAQAFNLVLKYGNGILKTVFLSHLSGENNTPELASEAFKALHDKYSFVCTSRSDASEVLLVKA
ncbi:MAG: MBL fold metallo-hydrolase [Prolixibacteraceae bacterium]|jgi:phosphoribosyl 1,2-cyclic phosphodiesterase|nr:MBL fold metallo-hydrolase [Prolixibacteraceae bacterium]